MYIAHSSQIAAGGEGSRIREFMNAEGFPEDFPKHLLPTNVGGQETLIGRIIAQISETPSETGVTVHANRRNYALLKQNLGESVRKLIVSHYDNSLGPFFDPLIRSQKRVLASAGDYYADISWPNFVAVHESRQYPISLVVGQSTPVEGGLAFEFDEHGKALAMRRADKTADTDLINVGAYIFEPDEIVLGILGRMAHVTMPKKEEVIFQEFIEAGLVGVYVVEGRVNNVNTPAAYTDLLNQNASGLQAAQSS